MSTVLVTGGAGYIGSHAVKALAQAGYDVVVYDDLSAGHRAAVSAITRALPGSAITLVEGDIADRQRVTDTLRTSGASAVMHFAAKLSVAESVTAPFAWWTPPDDHRLARRPLPPVTSARPGRPMARESPFAAAATGRRKCTSWG